MKAYDIYLVHASEDSQVTKELHDALAKTGLTVWFNSFRPGFSLRKQMEEGLTHSTCGAVIVTPNLFRKRWAVEELDALFSLESLDEGRIIPIWVGVSASDVLEASPMLSSRSAVIHRTIEETAGEVSKAVIDRVSNDSSAQWLRASILGGFRWLSGPGWLSKSLRRYDEEFPRYLHAMVHRVDSSIQVDENTSTPQVFQGTEQARIIRLAALLTEAPALDGNEVVLIAHQAAGTRQVLVKHFDLPAGMPDGAESLVSYVFQLNSVDLPTTQFAYVNVIGPYGPGLAPWSRNDELTFVVGMPVAYGNVPTSGGQVGQCVYVVARSVLFTPQVSPPS